MVEDIKQWQEVRSRISSKISNEDFKTMCVLHSKHFNHAYNEPCTCNKTTLRNWILQLDNKLKPLEE